MIPAARMPRRQNKYQLALAWIRRNRALCVAVALALGQLPLSIGYMGETRNPEQAVGPAPARLASETTQKPEKKPEPFLPARPDPFAPPSGQPTSAPGSSNQTTVGELPAMASALSIPSPLPPVAGPDAKPAAQAADPAAPPVGNPRLQGVVGRGDVRVAVFQMESGEVQYVRKSEAIPGSKLIVKDIARDSVVIADTSRGNRLYRMPVGKQAGNT